MMGFIIFILVIGVMGLGLYLAIALLDLLLEGKDSFLHKHINKLYKIITKLPSQLELDKANILHKCRNDTCNRMFRSYQYDMYKARHERSRCPHCEKSDYTTKISNPDKWMDTHPDCMKVSKVGYKNILKTIDLLHKLRKEDEQQQRFEEYNNLKVDFSWIKNLELEKENIK